VKPQEGRSEGAHSGPTVISRREWLLVGSSAAVLLLAVAVLHLQGLRHAPAGGRWSGFIGTYTNDYYGYLAWIRQARDGWFLFREQFTTEPHGRVFFHPLFWLAGVIPRVTGLPLMTGWWLVQALCTVALPLALYRFLAETTGDRAVRLTAFAIAMTGSGLGWLWGNLDGVPWERRPIDLWMPESGIFHTLTTSFFTLSAALAIMLMIFLHALRLARDGRRGDAVAMGLWTTALLAVHPYDVVEAGGVSAVFVLLLARNRWKECLLAGAIATPYAAYCAAVVFLDPVFSAHRGAVMERPTLGVTAAGFGVPLIAALVGAFLPGVRALLREIRFLLVWLAAGFVATQLPLGFERKLLWGLSVPLAALAAGAAVHALRRVATGSQSAAKARLIVAGGLAAFVALCGTGSVIHFWGEFQSLGQGSPDDSVQAEALDAFRWLEVSALPGDAILAGPGIAAMIPGMTGRTVFAGHWAQTIDLQEKSQFTRLLFGPAPTGSLGHIESVLRRNGIRWAVLDAASRSLLGLRGSDESLAVSKLGRIRFRNRLVTIWQIDQGEPIPWRSGNWLGR